MMTENVIVRRVTFGSSLKVGLVVSIIMSIIMAATTLGIVLLLGGVGVVDSTLQTIRDLTGFRLTTGWIAAGLGAVAALTLLLGLATTVTFSLIYNATSRMFGGLVVSTRRLENG